MAVNTSFRWVVCAVLAAYGIVVEIQLACMNVQWAPTFSQSYHPDLPLPEYVAGDLGIVKPGFRHFYLFVAYRHLAGIGFAEQSKAEYPPRSSRTAGRSGRPQRGIDLWQRARTESVGKGETSRKGNWRRDYRKKVPGQQWQFFLNCPDHAFRTAAATLQERVEKFGSESEEVRAWVEAQDIVFSNCQDGEKIPPDASDDLDPLIRADRAYQIAAAHFYSGHFAEAAARFQAIRHDGDSPWRLWGTYLAARSWIRKATLETDVDQVDEESFAKAAELLESVLGDPEEAERHASAEGLKGFVSARLNPARRIRGLADRLVRPDPEASLHELWTDYHYLLDRGHGSDRADDLTDWILTFATPGSDASDRSLKNWKRTGALPWLVASLTKIDAEHPNLDEVLEAAAAIPGTSSGHLTVTYYRFRLLAELGRLQELRDGLDEVLARSLPPISRNQFLALRMPLARSFREFLQFAPRTATNDRFYGIKPGSPMLFDQDSRKVFNTELPLTLLEESAQSELIPEPLRKEIALTAWARAGLIDEPESQLRLTPLVREHWPALAPDLDQFAATGDPVERKRMFLYMLLHHPGIRPVLRVSVHRATPIERIDNLRDNWWCGMERTLGSLKSNYEHQTLLNYERRNPRVRSTYGSQAEPSDQELAFLSASEKAEAQRQMQKLRTLESGPNYLSAQVIEWAKDAPGDRRVAEALHLSVRTTRYGCVDGATSDFSKAAFQLLHRRYPNSEWAERTKYWY